MEYFIEKKYRNYLQNILEQQSKPPSLLEEINKSNPEVIKILLKKTNSFERGINRIESLHFKKYTSKWNKTYIPN